MMRFLLLLFVAGAEAGRKSSFPACSVSDLQETVAQGLGNVPIGADPLS